MTCYLRHVMHPTDADFWAWDVVAGVARGESAEAAWDLVVELVRRVPNVGLGDVATGPLEEMVKTHGAALVDWIEGESRRDPRFKQALGRIWVSVGDLPPAIEARIVAASGGAIVRLSGDGGDEPIGR